MQGCCCSCKTFKHTVLDTLYETDKGLDWWDLWVFLAFLCHNDNDNNNNDNTIAFT